MKIAYVITRADAVGGASIHVRDLARAMIERGHEVLVLIGGEGPVTKQLTRAGVPFRSLRRLQRAISPLSDLLALRELKSGLSAFQPDLVSLHTAKAGWLGRSACHALGLPAIYTPHGWTIGDRISRVQGLVYTAAERIAARWARAIVCVSESERRLALEKRIAVAGKLHVIHNGVRDVAPELRARPGAHPPCLISVARFEAPKDHATLLQALASLASLDWQLVLVGDGPLESQLRGLAATLGVASRVRFAGYHPDPAALLAEAQVFVLSSRSEGFPRSILEAMRAGLPVVASNVGGVSEAVSHEANGLLVPRSDIDALRAALQRLLTHGALREQLGESGRHTYESAFCFDAMMAKTIAVYDSVVKRDVHHTG
ncbi:MAG: glycosyltransferase family 4 protein [Bryobacteraceae bacterium]